MGRAQAERTWAEKVDAAIRKVPPPPGSPRNLAWAAEGWIAAHLGVRRMTVWRWRRGRYVPSQERQREVLAKLRELARR